MSPRPVAVNACLDARIALIQINVGPMRLPHVVEMSLRILLLGLGVILMGAVGVARAQAVAPARQAELINLVRHDCGACHGFTLKGGLGPALTPQALAGKPEPYLKTIILDSRHGSAMPAWRGLLSEAEAAWLAEQLLKGLPDER